MSAKDIDKGTHWLIKLAQTLTDVNFGIVCLTPDNLNNAWILFESGATSKEVGEAHVSPYLFDLKPSDVTGPLAQFQMTTADKQDTFKLIQSINSALREQALKEDVLQQSFEKWWPDFENKLNQIKKEAKKEDTGSHRGDVHKIIKLFILLATRSFAFQNSLTPTRRAKP